MSFTRYVSQLEITPGLAYAPFWSAFIQVLRKTMEHEALRGRGQSTIKVSTSVTSDRSIIMIEDGGPGADWHAVRAACEGLGGSVRVECREDGGICLSFEFPAGAAASQGQARVSRRSGELKPSAA
jgi:hypothetical protein